ncbi:MAG: zinc carboxypeptidase [Balneolaceae bacterium]|nr:MAG: zinc carboxypeptidase [Balneolaceae bacterium]
MKKVLLASIFLFINPFLAFSQINLSYYLPDDETYNPNIPVPAEVIGHEVGEWHITHDKLVFYMNALAEASDRVTIAEYARTYENRPLVLLAITSPENHANIDRIMENHHALTDPDRSGNLDLSIMPVIVNLGYSVHGNEPSGSNASMLSAYYYAAAQGDKIDELLENAIILIDPSLNPDGLNRFATWVNMHKSATMVTDPASREFNEVWPNGRTNHYWFDLNRDWMPVVHPESRGRIHKFHKWRPNVLTDHHEMGTNATYFFQPGIPERTHPLTPQLNQDLTAAIAEYHADILDEVQVLYYTKEVFDDFYYGKGSTYPDVFGSVGILFEQASSRGHAQESVHGIVEFPYTIRNQFYTSLSTVNGSLSLRTELHEYRRSFYRDIRDESENAQIKAIVVGDAYDMGRNFHLADLLSHHNVEMYELARDLQVGGKEFKEGRAMVIPAAQAEYKFIEAMFERRTEFPDSLFYDISTWTLPFAFNMPFAELNQGQFNQNLLGRMIVEPELPAGSLIGGRSNYAYMFEWDEYYAPRTLYRLQKMGVRTKVASRPLTAITTEGAKEFSYGSILVALGIQNVSEDEIYHTLVRAAEEDGVNIYNITRGLSAAGIDLGSPSMNNLEKPRVAILAGPGISNLEVGEIWHQLDQRYRIPLTMIDKHRIGNVDLSRYNRIIITQGSYNDLNDDSVKRLKQWVRGGGVLILQKNAVNWARSRDIINLDRKEGEEFKHDRNIPYVDLQAARGAQVIGGSIFNGRLDITHPIGYGYRRSDIHVFRNSTLFFDASDNHFATPLALTNDPLASGYISDYNLEMAAGTASVVISSLGSGRVISFVDNPNFRAFWYGKNKMFANALFFGHTIHSASVGE